MIDAVYGSTGVVVASQRKLMRQKILFGFCASTLLNFKLILSMITKSLFIVTHKHSSMSDLFDRYSMLLMECSIHDVLYQTAHS